MADTDWRVQYFRDQILALEPGATLLIDDATWIQYQGDRAEADLSAITVGGWIDSDRDMARVGVVLTRSPEADKWIVSRPDE